MPSRMSCGTAQFYSFFFVQAHEQFLAYIIVQIIHDELTPRRRRRSRDYRRLITFDRVRFWRSHTADFGREFQVGGGTE